jgi:hypothetical protein
MARAISSPNFGVHNDFPHSHHATELASAELYTP